MLRNSSHVSSDYSMSLVPYPGLLSVDEMDLKFHTDHYNALPTIESATETLHSKVEFEDFLLKIKQIIVSYGLEDIVGLRLIHRHFDLSQEQVMVENFEMREGVPSLVTAAHTISDARRKGAVPASWIFYGSRPVVFELSTDQAVRSGVKKILAAPQFLTEIMNLIQAGGFQDLLALSIFKRESLPFEGEEVYLEKSFGDLGASVVQTSLPCSDSGFFVTGWTFNGESTYCWRSWCKDDYHHR